MANTVEVMIGEEKWVLTVGETYLFTGKSFSRPVTLRRTEAAEDTLRRIALIALKAVGEVDDAA